MLLPKLLIYALTFCELVIHLDAIRCPKGQKVTREGRCTPCTTGYYQPEENESQSCKPCTKCDKGWGSSFTQQCTAETNSKCKCRAGFDPWDSDSSTCKCNIGFGLKNEECSECEDGYFNNSPNSECKKWKECKSVEKNGTKTSDVVCRYLTNDRDITTTFITQLTSLRPREATRPQATRTTITTTDSPLQKGPGKEDPISFSNTDNYIGMILLLFGIVGLLILTAVTCKLQITPFMKRKTAVQKNESCRRPVEESGSLTSFKLNPEEP